MKDEHLTDKDLDRIKEIIINYEKIKYSISKLIDYDSNVPIKSEQLKALEAIRSEVLGMLVPCLFEQFKKQVVNLNIFEGFLKNSSLVPISGLLDLQYECHISNHNLDKNKIEKFKRKYLNNSLYIHKRKANIEIAGYEITNHILELFFDALSEYNVSKLKDCSTRTKHLLRYIGIDKDNDNSLGNKTFSDYQLALKVVDFISKASDTEIMAFYQGVTGLNTH